MDKKGVLEWHFGYTDFRPGQETLIDGVLAGRDVFGIMPTGGGKSICYQVPAMMLPGITVVVSPLISLMQDQVLALKSVGISAAYINSTLTLPQTNAVYRNLAAGQYKLLYVAPERLELDRFTEVAAALEVSFVAVDEAHCISEWGQDFRPSYLRIPEFIASLPRRPVVGAFTATATSKVRDDVERILRLRDPVRVVTGFDRPNLYFQVLRPDKKDPELLRLLADRKNKSGIIYCATRKKVESLCETLIDRGIAATRYHAGLSEDERSRNQEDFIHDRRTVMVATNAFGMGIDKSNVSYVIHYNTPKSLEAYYQEAGRAGRDGTDADCILMYSGSDVTTARFLINNSSDNEELSPDERDFVRKQDLARLDDMIGYCKSAGCLRKYILEYFGQEHPESCGNCGNCNGDFEQVDITREAQMILSCVKRIYDRIGYHVGATIVIRVLHGSRDKRILELGLDKVSTYGLMKGADKADIRRMVNFLEDEGFLYTEQEHMTLRLTDRASDVLFRGEAVTMRMPKKADPSPAKLPRAKKKDAASGVGTPLYEALRELRSLLAAEAGVPAYMIFSNAALADMAVRMPVTMEEFRQVSGVGEVKAKKYGDIFVNRIRVFLDGDV